MHFAPYSTELDLTGDLETLFQQGLRYARSIVKNQGDAEELVQESFYRLYRSDAAGDLGLEPSGMSQADQYSAVRNRALFFTTLRNACFDSLKRQRNRREVALEQAAGQTAQQNDPVAHKELVQVIDEVIEQLPESWADSLRLKISSDLGYTEIAEIIGATRAQVRTWIYRARRTLEAELAKRGLAAKNC